MEPEVVPMLAYEDGPAAMDWLAKAFGFDEVGRILGPDGRLSHGEMMTGEEGMIMLATPSPHYQSPRHHRESCEAAARWSEVPYVVDGVLAMMRATPFRSPASRWPPASSSSVENTIVPSGLRR